MPQHMLFRGMQPVPQSVDPTSHLPDTPPVAKTLMPGMLGECPAVSVGIRADSSPLISVLATSVWTFMVTFKNRNNCKERMR